MGILDLNLNYLRNLEAKSGVYSDINTPLFAC